MLRQKDERVIRFNAYMYTIDARSSTILRRGKKLKIWREVETTKRNLKYTAINGILYFVCDIRGRCTHCRRACEENADAVVEA